MDAIEARATLEASAPFGTPRSDPRRDR